MSTITEIMEIANTDKETAIEIFHNMFIDFSECTQKQFENEIKRAASEINSTEDA